MKKFFALMICLLMISAQASAMNLTLNKSIGLISLAPRQYELQIKGYTNLDGNFSKGVAQFGNLYFHFDAAKKISSFGDESKKNSVSVDTSGETEIFIVRVIGETFGGFFFVASRRKNRHVQTVKIFFHERVNQNRAD